MHGLAYIQEASLGSVRIISCGKTVHCGVFFFVEFSRRFCPERTAHNLWFRGSKKKKWAQ